MTGLFKGAAKTPYKNRDALLDKYVPDQIVGRDKQKKEVVNALTPVFTGDTPDNLILNGPPGVGKTAVARHVLQELRNEPEADHVTVGRLNCNGSGGETTLMLEIANLFRPPENKRALTGYKKARARDMMFQELDRVGDTIILVLDEIDAIEDLDTFLYQISRPHETGRVSGNIKIGLIGICNDPSFLRKVSDDRRDTLDAKIVHFGEYNALQLRPVIAHRAALAFKHTEVDGELDENASVTSDTLKGDIVQLTAAYASRDYGDARTAISLLRYAGDIARDCDSPTVDEDHLELAVDKLRKHEITEQVEELGATAKTILYALLALTQKRANFPDDKLGSPQFKDMEEAPRTREITGAYLDFMDRCGRAAVSDRQVRKSLSRLEKCGLASPVKQEGGRGGTYTTWVLEYPPEPILHALDDVVDLVGVAEPLKDTWRRVARSD